MATFDSDGVRIHFEQTGQGDPVVLVHGFASNARNNWIRTGWVDLLARKYQAITLDCRGHGESGKPHDRQAYASGMMEGDVIRLMDHLAIGRALLMGYSMGGRIAMGLLAAHPERLRAVVLGGVGSGGGTSDPSRRQAIVNALLADDKDSIESEAARQFRDFAEANRNDLKAMGACMGAERRDVDVEKLAAGGVPVLIVVGSDDVLVGSPDPLTAAIPGSRLLRLKGRDHLTAVDDPLYKESVLEFFSAAPR